MTRSIKVRNRLLNKVAKALLRRGAPRLQMSLMVFLTALSGFVASFSMLMSGIRWMWFRYPIAVLVAYAVFLSLIWCWLKLYQKTLTTDLSFLDLPGEIVEGDPSSLTAFHGGGGGEFGGGGASGSFATDSSSADIPASPEPSKIMDGIDLPFDADELILIFVVLGVSLFAIAVAIMMVISAPTLLGEVLIDGALGAGLYRHLKKMENRNWLESAVNRTWLPVLGLIIFFAVAGLVLHWYAPNADSIGDVWIHFKSNLKA